MNLNRLISRAWLANDQVTSLIVNAVKTDRSQSSTPELAKLEERILLSASPITELAVDSGAVQQESQTSSEVGDSSVQAATQIVFIDSQVEDYDQLAAGLVDGASLQVFLLDAERDGIEQISQALQQFSDLEAVHLVSHGGSDSIGLGNVTLTSDNLIGYAAEISAWESSLSADADLLIYGCNLAAGEQGRLLIDSVSSLTGANVAASDDLTGHQDLGGDWDLEYTAGEIEASVVFSVEVQHSWVHLLPTGWSISGDALTSEGSDASYTIGYNGTIADSVDLTFPISTRPARTTGILCRPSTRQSPVAVICRLTERL